MSVLFICYFITQSRLVIFVFSHVEVNWKKEGKFEYQEVCVSLKLAFYKKSSHTVPPIITEPKASNTGLPV